MKPWIVLSLLLVPFFASAADFWDGNAALQRGDATFESGLYATSNSFAPGTQITILNQDTGKTVTATVTGRIEGQSDILVLLSPKAAQALGLSLGTLGRVRVTLPARSGATASARNSDQTISSDPDVNPAAGTGQEQPTEQQTAEQPTEQPTTEQQTAEQPTEQPTTEQQTAEQPAEQPTTEQQTAEQPAEQPTTEQQTAEQPAEQPTTGQQTAEQPAEQPAASAADAAAILSDAQARSPQKQVFQPPREDQKFAYHPPANTQPQTTTPQTAAAAAPAITSVEGEPGVTPPAPASQSMALADVTAPEESRPQEVVSEGTAAPAPASGAPAVALAAPEVAPEQPAAVAAEPVQTEVTAPAAVPPAAGPTPRVALAPPETPAPARTAPASSGTAATTSTAATASSASAASTVQTVQPAAVAVAAAKPGVKGAFYLQLAAFAAEQTARDLAAKLAPTYPALVLAPGGAGTSVYKVVIGPLNRAESGTLLLWFRYRGYPDAFLRQE